MTNRLERVRAECRRAQNYSSAEGLAVNILLIIDGELPKAAEPPVVADGVEAAYREGYEDGWCTGTAAMEEDRAWNADDDWKGSKALAMSSRADVVEDGEAIDDLKHRLRMIVSHATCGHLSEAESLDWSVNDICVEISRSRNLIYQQGKDDQARSRSDHSPLAP